MALQFYFGGSGVGKSRKLHQDIIAQAIDNPKTNYLIIVPDQFTMQTQMDLVTEHPNHGIMNIDVLSFGRLSHRILEEVGAETMPLLDDTGKSLILRRIAKQMENELPALGSKLKKIGYVHEVKSIISEFMQYGIAPDGVHELVEYAAGRGALKSKLADLELLYRAFLAYIDKQYLTKEETLGLLKRSLHKSDVVKDAVIVFDGFTGFTPIQYQVIQELMVLAKDVKITIILNGKENPYVLDGEQKLFHLSKKTVQDVKKLADQVSISETAPVLMLHKETGSSEQEKAGREEIPAWAKEAGAEVIWNEHTRFEKNEALEHLEKHMLRYPIVPFEGKADSIHLSRANSISGEIRETCIQIRKLIREKGYQYRDIAVVSGNLAGYANLMEQIFSEYDIPVYMDYTHALLQNPFTRYICSALRITVENFSIDSMMKYLRCGLSDVSEDEVDRLENYLRKCGLKGKKAWTHPFAKKGKNDEGIEPIIVEMNGYREKIIAELEPLLQKGNTANDYIKNLYAFLVKNACQEKLAKKAEFFKDQKNPVREKEYSQLYRLTIDLLDQMQLLLGSEVMEYEDFLQILEAGFGELKVGTIPGEVDKILVGDMERTRLKEVKVLFFLGINDGNIPKGTSKGGLISDIDREFLQQSQYEFAPTPRQQMYIQRLYLYMNMTKPSEELYLSFAALDEAGTLLQPSYLIATVQQMYPNLQLQIAEEGPWVDKIESQVDVENLFALSMREYAEQKDAEEAVQIVKTIYLGETDKERLDSLVNLAFSYYQNTPLARKIASMIYGQILAGSISRLETYATCAYKHFLKYGLSLKEREEFDFEAVDLGNVYHVVLDAFSHAIEEHGYTWLNFPKEFADRMIDELLENEATGYGDMVLYSTARMKNALSHMSRILKRSVDTMKEQLSKGSFLPKQFEMKFQKIESLEDLNLELSNEEKIKLSGRVDRVDIFEEPDKVYVKITDYKSGDKSFDLAAVYYGLQLQLVVYMDAVCEVQKSRNQEKEIVPAAMLYYHLDDPIIEESEQMTEAAITAAVRSKLASKGLVTADEHIVSLLDNTIEGKSDVIPVKLLKGGGYDKSSKVVSEEGLKLITDYVNHSIKRMGQEIVTGNINVSPFEGHKPNGDGACSYCEFKSVCSFDASTGYKDREKEIKDEGLIYKKMKEELGKDDEDSADIEDNTDAE